MFLNLLHWKVFCYVALLVRPFCNWGLCTRSALHMPCAGFSHHRVDGQTAEEGGLDVVQWDCDGAWSGCVSVLGSLFVQNMEHNFGAPVSQSIS